MDDQIRSNNHIGHSNIFFFELEHLRINPANDSVVEDIQPDGCRRLRMILAARREHERRGNQRGEEKCPMNHGHKDTIRARQDPGLKRAEPALKGLFFLTD